MGVLLPHGGEQGHYKAVQDLPDKINIRPKEIIGWYPSKFGANLSIDLSLREDSYHVGRDIFGQEITITSGDLERKNHGGESRGTAWHISPVEPTCAAG